MADFKGVIEVMALEEVASTYTTPQQRAAYRAGLSTAAAICDQNAASYGTANQRARAVSSALTKCGDQISQLREKIEVTKATASGGENNGT
jgi:hypothetical protein